MVQFISLTQIQLLKRTKSYKKQNQLFIQLTMQI